MLSPRLIATEGFGGDARLVAVRGLWTFHVEPPMPLHEGYTGGFRAKRTRRNVEEDEALLLALLR